MSDPDAYIALVASLPSSERLFVARQPPLSRLRLEKKLNALSAEDHATLGRIERLLGWRAYALSDSDQIAIDRARATLDSLHSPTLVAIVNERLALRTVVSALRRRHRGEGPPTAPRGVGRRVAHMAANWADPTFKLDASFVWLRQANILLEQQDPLGLERHILEVTYHQLQRHAARHFFDFEAVVIYVLKWNIFDRWARSDARAATHRFNALAHDALGDFADLTLEGVT